MRKYDVKLIYEDGMWYSEMMDNDINLTLESGSFNDLIERVKIAVQDILETDFKYTGDVQFLFQAERVDSIKCDRVTA